MELLEFTDKYGYLEDGLPDITEEELFSRVMVMFSDKIERPDIMSVLRSFTDHYACWDMLEDGCFINWYFLKDSEIVEINEYFCKREGLKEELALKRKKENKTTDNPDITEDYYERKYIGKKFFKLTCLEITYPEKGNAYYRAKFRCECGNVVKGLFRNILRRHEACSECRSKRRKKENAEDREWLKENKKRIAEELRLLEKEADSDYRD